MTTCDICGGAVIHGKTAQYGARGDGGKSGPKPGDYRHYNCHTGKYGKTDTSITTTQLLDNIRSQLQHMFDDAAIVPVIAPRTVKVPFITKGEHNRSENAQRPYKTTGRVISEMGRRRVEIECPFCDNRFWAFPWSIAGVGKKCPNCGSMHALFGVAYPLIGNEDM